MKKGSVGLLTVAHASADINQGAVPVLLPLFIAAHGLSYAAAATIVFSLNLVSTVFQPVFGYVSDRRPAPWLLPLSMLLIGLGVSFTGYAPTYAMGVAAVMVSGLGIAMFHPEGALLMNHLAGEKKATAMSLFAIGGQLGFAVGPIAAWAALSWWDLKGTGCLMIPPALMAAILLYMLPRLTAGYATRTRSPSRRPETATEGRDRWPAFICLAGALLSRSVVFYGLNTFLPLFWIHELHRSRAQAGTALTIMLVALMVGNFTGGRTADRLGLRTVAITSFFLLSCFLPALLYVSSPLAATLLLVPIGFILSAPFGPMVVLGQSYLPQRVGLASGITLGLAFSFGGLTTPLLGWVGDHHGLRALIGVVACMPLLCLALTVVLPSEKSMRNEAQPASAGY
jgi:FSR family fosmidomycin resistance protein-like MFS transporter